MLIKELFRMGTTFWLLGNNKQLYAHMSRGPHGCVGTLVFSRMKFINFYNNTCIPSKTCCYNVLHQFSQVLSCSAKESFIFKLHPTDVLTNFTPHFIEVLSEFFLLPSASHSSALTQKIILTFEVYLP